MDTKVINKDGNKEAHPKTTYGSSSQTYQDMEKICIPRLYNYLIKSAGKEDKYVEQFQKTIKKTVMESVIQELDRNNVYIDQLIKREKELKDIYFAYGEKRTGISELFYYIEQRYKDKIVIINVKNEIEYLKAILHECHNEEQYSIWNELDKSIFKGISSSNEKVFLIDDLDETLCELFYSGENLSDIIELRKNFLRKVVFLNNNNIRCIACIRVLDFDLRGDRYKQYIFNEIDTEKNIIKKYILDWNEQIYSYPIVCVGALSKFFDHLVTETNGKEFHCRTNNEGCPYWQAKSNFKNVIKSLNAQQCYDFCEGNIMWLVLPYAHAFDFCESGDYTKIVNNIKLYYKDSYQKCKRQEGSVIQQYLRFFPLYFDDSLDQGKLVAVNKIIQDKIKNTKISNKKQYFKWNKFNVDGLDDSRIYKALKKCRIIFGKNENEDKSQVRNEDKSQVRFNNFLTYIYKKNSYIKNPLFQE